MSDDLIQPPKTPIDWGRYAKPLIVAAIVFAAGVIGYVYQEAADKAFDRVMRPIAVREASVEQNVDELTRLIRKYQDLSAMHATATGQRRSDLLDERTAIVGRINTLIDLIPHDKLPATASRFVLAR